MYVRVTIPIEISMVLEDVATVDEAKEQVKSICADDPSIVSQAIDCAADLCITLEAGKPPRKSGGELKE